MTFNPFSSSRRDALITAGLLFAAAALAALLALRAPLGVDYTGAPSTFCDCPGTPIRALAHGRLHDFLATQPVMGSASLLLRSPFAWLGLHLGAGSERDLYRLGAFPCLLAAGLLATYLFGRMRELRRATLACVLVPFLVAVNPLTRNALNFGHPEELLTASLCVGALLAAARGRALAAGLLLGVAVATKQWAVLAVLPALAAAGPRWGRVALAAAVTAAVLIVPMAAGDLHRFLQANN
ncbi:MAG TPA: glycosyltransferase 87 family protein, partial [Thermoleophilaceae bacterium]|nr:glycosyltransferase 87 family protein [Thermoleophilaceae bacterium]